MLARLARLALTLITIAAPAQKTDLHLTLNGKDKLTRVKVSYACSPDTGHIGLPRRFTAEFIHGAGVDLLTFPLDGTQRVFAQVLDPENGEGRYVYGPYVWWMLHNGIVLSKRDAKGSSLGEIQCVIGVDAEKP